jgi:CRP-like cAMP-binding protein
LRDAVRQSPPLLRLLMAYTHGLLTHMAQSSVCLRHHRLEQQLCRWLLLHLDRRPDNVIAATHDGIAQLLGVRREGVTTGAQRLQRAGLIRCSRGRIELRDRAGLEARCCECYGVVREAVRREPRGHGAVQSWSQQA